MPGSRPRSMSAFSTCPMRASRSGERPTASGCARGSGSAADAASDDRQRTSGTSREWRFIVFSRSGRSRGKLTPKSTATGGEARARREFNVVSVSGTGLEREIEGGAFAGPRVGPDPAAVAVDHPLDDGKAHAGSLVLFGAVEPLEPAEELVGVAHVEAGAVVFHVVDVCGAHLRLFPAADLDDGGVLVAREFDRVSEQIREHLLQQRRVRHGGSELPDGEFDAAVAAAGAQLVDDLIHEIVQFHGLGPERLAPEAR